METNHKNKENGADKIYEDTTTIEYVYEPSTSRLKEVRQPRTGMFTAVAKYEDFIDDLIKNSYPNVPTVAGTGNGDRRLKAIKHYTSTSTLDAQHDYTYNASGNITQWTQHWAGLTAGNDYKLRYDGADQLISADRRNTATGHLDRQDAWGYDLAGNRELAQASIRDGSGNYSADLVRSTHNALNQITGQTGGAGVMRFEGTVNEPCGVDV